MRRDEARQERLKRLGIVVGCVVLAYLLFDKVSSTVQAPVSPEIIAAQIESENKSKQEAFSRLERKEVASEILAQATAIQEALSDTLQDLQKASARLETSIDQVRTDAGPNSIAGDRQALREFQYLLQHPRPSRMKLTSYRKRFEAFDELVTGAARAETIGSGATISRDTVQRMESLQLEVKESLSVIEDLQGKLDAIVKYAKPLEGTSDENVQQSLAELEATQNKQAMEKQAEAVEQVRQEYETKLAQMAAETERILQEARLQKLLKDREAALEEARKEAEFAAKQAEERIARMEQEAAAELAAQKRKREKEQLEKDFSADRARIERVLAPFLNPGKSVPGPPNQWGRQAEPKPMSFSVIEGRGALENSEAGYQAFMWLAGSTENDRNNGSYPTYIGGTVNRSLLDSILEAQQLLRKYGPLLVEKELLLK